MVYFAGQNVPVLQFCPSRMDLLPENDLCHLMWPYKNLIRTLSFTFNWASFNWIKSQSNIPSWIIDLLKLSLENTNFVRQNTGEKRGPITVGEGEGVTVSRYLEILFRGMEVVTLWVRYLIGISIFSFVDVVKQVLVFELREDVSFDWCCQLYLGNIWSHCAPSLIFSKLQQYIE